MTVDGWEMHIARADPGDTVLVPAPVPTPRPGEAVLRTGLVAVTANTTAYAELGERLRYWDFFPVEDPGRGTSPLWGFADVVASRSAAVAEGTRVYGFLPTASHAVVEPQAVGPGRFRDVRGLRPTLPAAYNSYWDTAIDAGYLPADREDLQVVFRPLFITSWALADWLTDSARPPVDRILFSSASSKTAMGTALLLARGSAKLVGLTGPARVEDVRSSGVYDEVLGYDQVDRLDPRPSTRYVDIAGSASLLAALRAGPCSQVEVVTVGQTHHEGVPDDGEGFWFAPSHLRDRGRAWGPGVLHAAFSAAYREALPVLTRWTHTALSTGPDGLQEAWTAALNGSVPTGTTPVVRL